MPFHISLKVHYLHQATVKLPPPNNNREETGLPTPTCPQETIYLPFLRLAVGIVTRNSVELSKFINDTLFNPSFRLTHCQIEAVQHFGPGPRVGKGGSPEIARTLNNIKYGHVRT